MAAVMSSCLALGTLAAIATKRAPPPEGCYPKGADHDLDNRESCARDLQPP